jgi:hypothetical protein
MRVPIQSRKPLHEIWKSLPPLGNSVLALTIRLTVSAMLKMVSLISNFLFNLRLTRIPHILSVGVK